MDISVVLNVVTFATCALHVSRFWCLMTKIYDRQSWWCRWKSGRGTTTRWLHRFCGVSPERMPHIFICIHTHTCLMALCPGLPRWAITTKVKPIWILLKQETVSGSGIIWAICKSAPRCRQITMPAPHHSVFCRPGALSAAQPTASKHWRQHLHIHRESKKKQDTKLLAITSLTIIRFSKFFH